MLACSSIRDILCKYACGAISFHIIFAPAKNKSKVVGIVLTVNEDLFICIMPTICLAVL